MHLVLFSAFPLGVPGSTSELTLERHPRKRTPEQLRDVARTTGRMPVLKAGRWCVGELMAMHALLIQNVSIGRSFQGLLVQVHVYVRNEIS